MHCAAAPDRCFCWIASQTREIDGLFFCVLACMCAQQSPPTLVSVLFLPGQELEVKLIRDRHRGIVAGYGFIDFRNHETAQLVLDSLNGKPIGEMRQTRWRRTWCASFFFPCWAVYCTATAAFCTNCTKRQAVRVKYLSTQGRFVEKH